MQKITKDDPFSELYCIIDDEGPSCDLVVKHRNYFQFADITVCVENFSLPGPTKFKKNLLAFATDGPGEDNVTLRHHFFLPDLTGIDLGVELYNEAPWAIYQKNGCWIYKGILPMVGDDALHQVIIFSGDYRLAIIFSPERFLTHISDHGYSTLSLMTTDQIWQCPLLAERSAIMLHSSAAIINGQGLIFVGNSDAGKSTTIELLKTAVSEKGLDFEILCDDRNIIRHRKDGWRVHGTWSHGDIADVSPLSAPLRAVLFLKQAKQNEIIQIVDRKMIWRQFLATLIRPMVTAKWWQQEMDTLEKLVKEVPCYSMCFDKSGAIFTELERLIK